MVEGIPVPGSLFDLLMILAIFGSLYGREWGRAAIEWWRARQTKQLEDQSSEQAWHLEMAREAHKRADHMTTLYIKHIERELAEAKKSKALLQDKLHQTRKLLESRGLEEVSDDLHLADVAPSKQAKEDP